MVLKSPNSFVFRCSNAVKPMICNRHLSKTLITSNSNQKRPVFPPPLFFLSSLNCQPSSQILIQPTIKRAEQSRHGSDMVSYALCQPAFYVITSCVRPALIRAQSCHCLLLLIHHLPISCT